MRLYLLSALAATVLSTSGVALAQSAHYDGYGDGYDRGSNENFRDNGIDGQDPSYGDARSLQAQLDRDAVRIQRGMQSGAFSRYRASAYFQELQEIRREAWRGERQGGNDGEVEQRLDRLHARMDRAYAGSQYQPYGDDGYEDRDDSR